MGLSRREFSKLGGDGVGGADAAVGGSGGAGWERKIGYCVIGLGTIADHFMRGVLSEFELEDYGAGERASG